MAIPRKPRLLFECTIERRPYIRRLLWSVLAAVTALAAAGAFEVAAGQGLIDSTVQTIGTVAGVVALIWFGLRALRNLWRALRRQDETLRFYDRGFIWSRRGQTFKYGWGQVASYRETWRGLRLRGRPLIQWGSFQLRMQDGKVFRITGKHGDLRQFSAAVRRYPARVTGVRMAQRLREELPVTLHRQLVIWPGGIQAGKEEIPWSKVDVRVRAGRVVVLRQDENGKYRPVGSYSVRNVDNVGGLMELVPETVRNHQRERVRQG
jgi:hypothetical protein